jgi:hypothetical protein
LRDAVGAALGNPKLEKLATSCVRWGRLLAVLFLVSRNADAVNSGSGILVADLRWRVRVCTMQAQSRRVWSMRFSRADEMPGDSRYMHGC